jgi:hypothetical protein
LSERIYKLQPDRTIQLRGFDDLGASAALHSATPSSFKVSGVFRDAADFAVVILYDADNFYEHPRLKYLPDTDFSGLTLTFDVHYSGLMPLDSPKYPTIDWPYLDVIRPDGSTAKVHLFSHAVQAGGSYTRAEASFVIEDNGLQPYDRITLWYLNFAFDYIVPNDPELPTAAQVASALAAQINGVDWEAFGTLIPLGAEAEGNTLRIVAQRPGADGNMLRMYAVSKNDRLRTTQAVAAFQGGSSDATWRITLDFEALDIGEIRQMWLTLAPPLADGAALADTEWEAAFTNWTVSGPEAKRALAVAGPGSVRVEETDSWCKYTGNWVTETGFYSKGYARRASAAGDSVTVCYTCPSVHDLYIGTSLYSDRSVAGIRLDEDQETDLDCRLDAEPAVVTRRRVRTAVPAGAHTVTIRLKTAGHFYFDFLEAAVASDVPEPPPPAERVAPALDYSTDHTYKLPPSRILWMFDQLGYAGPMNEYIGVFWWNQRKREGAVIPSVTVTFDGQFLPEDQVFLSIGGQTCGKTVFPNEDAAVIARHFQHFINATYVGVWASAEDNVLTITARSPRPAYSYTFQAWKESGQGSGGTVAFTGSLQGGDPGRWVVDPSQTPALNRGARDWHLDFFNECRLHNREITVACSMELVNPPEDFGARFPDGQVVETSVGFGSLVSTHCAFSSPMLNYQKQVFKTLADLMAAASVEPSLQFGEFCWWYFTNRSASNPGGGMAYYDEETKSAAVAALGRPLHVFTAPDDDPGANGGADAVFLRNRLRSYVSALASHVRSHHPSAKLEVLFPYDVNHPTPAGVHLIGGRLNRFVNLPVEWEQQETSGLDRLKIEALDFGAWSRDLDLTQAAVSFGLGLAWPRESLRHMLPVFQPGYAWEKECAAALGERISAANLWAFDHICLFGEALSPSLLLASARQQG